MAETIPPLPAYQQQRVKHGERRFRDAVAAQGGAVTGTYRNNRTRVDVVCPVGHRSAPVPYKVLLGGGICPVCSRQCPEDASDRFRVLVEGQGGAVIGAYVDNKTRVEVQCASGHTYLTAPTVVFQGYGICGICSKKSKADGEDRFRVTVQERDGVVVGDYVDSRTPVEIRCPEGHTGFPKPADVLSGQGMCRECAGKKWDVFYVVRDGLSEVIKVGITSGSPKHRLSAHRRAGLDDVVCVYEGLPGTVAPDLERNILEALRDAGEHPVRGREYFHERALALVLDLVNNHPGLGA